ncbi:MAG: hypothetical protein ACE5H5_06140, partial [Nitrospinota bacterium]
MIGEVLASLLGRGSLWAGSPLNEIGIEFVSPRYFYEFFSQEAEAWQGELPSMGWFHGVVIVCYLALLYYVWRRFRIVEQLRQGWAESRQRQAQAKAARAERRMRLEAAEAEADGVSYEAFQALREANRTFDEGRYAEALGAYEAAGRLSPPLSAAWVGRGAALGCLGRHAEAREAFGQAL